MNLIVRGLFITIYVISLYFLIYWLVLYSEVRHRIKKEKKIVPYLRRYPTAAILVPAYNEEKTILKTLKSISRLNYPKDKFEVHILNNASKDRTEDVSLEFIKHHPELNIKYHYIAQPGKAKAMNKGLSIIKTKYFACLDADSTAHKNALLEMMAKFERGNDELTILTPVMKIENPQTMIQKMQRIEYLFGAMMAKLMSYMDANYVAPGPFSVYKTDRIRELGGFDEKSIVEDQEIAYKVQQKHYKIAQCSNAFVYTLGPKDAKALRNQRNRWVKGTILTLFDYRKLFFNKKYGEFGIFQLPVIFTYYLLGLFSLNAFLYFTIKPIYKLIKNLSLINYDIIPFIQTFKFTFDIWSIDFLFTFLLNIMLVITIVFLFIASRTTDDKLIKGHGFLSLLLYFYLYFLLLSTVLIEVVVELIIGKKQRW